jgi:hypothetical protein
MKKVIQIAFAKSEQIRKFVGLLLFFIMSMNSYGQKIQTMLGETWTNNSWQNATLMTNTYDGTGYLTNSLSQTWVVLSSTWQNGSQTVFTNNLNGTVNQEVTQTWNGSAWTNVFRLTFTYNSSNKVLSTISELWFGAIWMNSSKITNTYDVNGYLTNQLTQTWDFISSFKNSNQVNYTNNPDGTVNQEITQKWDGVSAWNNLKRATFTYNGSGKVLTTVNDTWTAGAWQPSDRETNTYDLSGRVLTTVTDTWTGGVWLPDSKETNSYDGSGHMTNTLSQTWDTGSTSWKNSTQSNFTNNPDGTPYQVVSQTWDGVSTWNNTHRITFNYVGQPGPSGQTLTYRFANPRVIRVAGIDNFEFDVQVVADAAGKYFWSGQIVLNYDNTTLSTAAAEWTVTGAAAFVADNSLGSGHPKYNATNTITGSTTKVLNIGITGDLNVFANGPNATDFTGITTSYQTMVTVRGRITSGTGVAGLSFLQSSMNGQQSFVSGVSTFTNYTNPNLYNPADLLNAYVGRIYSGGKGWSQVGNTSDAQWVDWTAAVNTSVWDGTATTPATGESRMGALRIHSPATLTIPPSGQLTCTNGEINTALGLVIQSTSAGTGSFIDNGTTATVGSGSAAVQRDMTADQYHIVSPSVTNLDIATFKVSNAVDKIRNYSESAGVWSPAVLASGSFVSGNGYLLNRTAANVASTGVAAYAGTPASGNQSINVTRTGNGWNCIGNPFTSAILATGAGGLLTLNSTQLDPSFSGIYVWDEQPGYNGTQINYKVICNTPYTFPTGVTQLVQDYLQTGQGFFVKPKTGGGSISIPTSLRSHQNAIGFKSAEVSWPAIKLVARGQNQSDYTIVAFNSNMTNGLDPTYDVGMLKGNPNFSLYSRLVEDNGVDFAVQSLPDRDFGKYCIPIGIDCKDAGEVTFTAETVNLPAGIQVTLQDMMTHTNTRLDLKNAKYTATIAQGTEGPGRFFLITEGKLVNGNDLQLQGDLTIYTIGKTIYIKGEVSPDARFALYSIDGKLLSNFKAGWTNQNHLDASYFPSGTYILTVTDKNQRKSAKVILGK